MAGTHEFSDDAPGAALTGVLSEREPAATDETSAHARNGAAKRRDPNEPAAVVGLGASAGGVAVLQQFFGDMAPDSGLAFVVVMHLSPEHESNLANVIQQKTIMPVLQVTEPVQVQRNHIYVIPPNKHLTFQDSTLQLVEPQQALGRRVTIDLFFRTLAQAFGQRAVCMILSGTDSDGVIGLKHVRAQGGLTIAQAPDEAEHDSMPVTAIATGMVDWILPVGEMAPKLLEFVTNENRMQLPPEIPEAAEPDVKVQDAPGGETVSDETRAPGDESALGDVLAHVRTQTGHDFSHYKRATVLRRVARRLQVNSLETIPQYLTFLRKHPAEARALLQDLLIGVTHFFRDQEAFAALAANIPQLFAGKRKDDQVRVWVAGCATGEEAYSIAMLLCEHAARLDSPPSIQIFASDVDEQAIQDARDGLYPLTIEADVSTERLKEFFVKDHGRYRVRKEVREKVLFASHNLLKDAPFSRLDLISCRNLLIYLNTKAQDQVFDIFHFSLRPGGLLFIGGSEAANNVHALFSSVDPKHRIYVRRSIPRPSWKVPLLPVRALDGSGMQGAASPRPRKLPALAPGGFGQAEKETPGAQFAGQERRAVLFGELHLKLLEQYGPPSVVVNEMHDIVHLSEHAGRYLQFAAGEPTANVVTVVNPVLRIELRTALFRAAQTKESFRSAPQRVDFEGASEVVTLSVQPANAGETGQGYYLVLFEKQNDVAAPPAPGPAAHDSVTRDLEAENQYLKEQVAATTEQYEATTEELKASNEELQSMNEEMRSATEELETSKEELLSVNEELTTVNNELKSSVEELSRANTDLNNLMASTDIATIFLDRHLRIQRFTPSAQKIFNLIPADLGRPISDITNKLAYAAFIADAEKVLHDLAVMEREVCVAENSWFLTRIAPYRTANDRIAGVVATFIDITRRKVAEDDLRRAACSHQQQVRIFDTALSSIADFAYTFDKEGRFVFANQALATLLQVKPEEMVGKNFFDLGYPPELAEKLQSQIQQVIRTGKKLRDETPFTDPAGRPGYYEYIFNPVPGPDGSVESVVGSTRDLTERKNAEHALRESEERFRTVSDNVPQVIWTNEAEGKANYFNKRWYDYSGLTYEQSVDLGWQAIVHPDDAPASIARWREALAEGKVFDVEYRLRQYNGNYRWHLGRNVPLRSKDGSVLGWFGTATDIEDFKQAEAALRESDERFRLLVEGARDYAMFLIDVDNCITFWSKGAERLFGWSEEEATGCSADLIFTLEDRANGAVEKELDIALEEGRALDRRWHMRKDGSRFWADGILMKLDNDTAELRGFAKIARDATDQRQNEEALAHARDQLEQRVIERTAEFMQSNRELQNEIKQRQQLERELLEVTERERSRIGQDLHDILCQELTATALFLKSSGNNSPDEASAKALSEAAQIVNRNVSLARDLARGFQPALAGTGGLTGALRILCEQANRKPNVTCRLKLPRAVRIHDQSIALNLYRIAQEAVANAVRHSGGSEIVVCVEREPQRVRLVVEDNGKGLRLRKRSKGLGVHIMRYRANVLGGTIMFDLRPKSGTKITCEVPLPKSKKKK